MSQQRHLAAILFTDIVGYTALMQENEQKAVALIKHYSVSLNKSVGSHEGKVLNYYGDGSLCTFPSATEALNCAIELQKELQSDPQVPLRIGLHIGEIFFEEDKALGDGVNIASRIQSIGQANTILFSKEMYDKIRNQPEFKPASLGMFNFKNVEEPLEVFALENEGLVVPRREQMSGKLTYDLPIKKGFILRNSIVGSFVAISLIAAVLLYLKFTNRPNYSVEKSVAVLPFDNMLKDSQQAIFADGMMEEIQNRLYKIGGLKVSSRASSLRYKETKKTNPEIASELGVANLLVGTVQKDGNLIKISAQLVDGKTDNNLWADTYVRDESNDIFAIQSDIAQQIASALKVKIDPVLKERIEFKPTKSTEAYDLYLKSKNSDLPREKSRAYLETAMKLDSEFADAYAALAFYWLIRGGNGGDLTSKEVLNEAEPLLQKAIEINPNLAFAHRNRALMDLWYKWDFVSAGNEYDKVIQLNPSSNENAVGLVDYYLSIGNITKALEVSNNVFKQDSSSYSQYIFALANYFNGDNKTALDLIDRAFSKDRTNEYIWSGFIRINVYTENYKGALQAYEKFNHVFGKEINFLDLARCAICYYKTGHEDSTEKLINIINERSKKSPVGSPSYCIANIYIAMGEKDKAILWLQKAYKDHEVEVYWLKVEPLFKPLHSDPRFKDLLVKIGFK